MAGRALESSRGILRLDEAATIKTANSQPSLPADKWKW
jgi:hypothetical protein